MVKPPDHLSRGDLQQGDDQPVNLRQQEDFSLQQMRRREQAAAVDVGETYRQMIRRAERVESGEARAFRRPGARGGPTPATRLRAQSREYLETYFPLETANEFRPPVGGNYLSQQMSYAPARREYASKLLEDFNRSRRSRTEKDLSNFPYLDEIKKVYEEFGEELTTDDINNLAMWGQAEEAARAYARHLNAGNEILAKNIALTISDPIQGDPIQAALFGGLIEEAIQKYIEPVAKDPGWIDNTLEWLGDKAMTALGYILGPGDEVNKYSVAQAYESTGRNPFLNYFFPVVTPSEESYKATEPGKFNENYLQRLIGDPERGLWTALEVELATEVVRRDIQGVEKPIASAWNDREDREDPEVAKFFADMQFMFDDDKTRINQLIRQIQSVDLSSFAALNRDAANPDLEFDPVRGDEWYRSTQNISDATSRILSDPINLVPIPIRAGAAARWKLSKLRPGAVDAFGNPIRAVDVLSKRSLGPVNINTPASRYHENFARDLNRLDDLESAVTNATDEAAAAAARRDATRFRQKMTEDYDAFDEGMIESFRTNPAHKRNAEGRFDLETVAQYIDDTNAAFETLQGNLNTKLAEQGFLDVADQLAVEEFLAQRPLYAQSVGATTRTRDLMIPRRTLVSTLRRNMVNSIILDVAPAGTARRIIEKHFNPNMSTAQIAQRMDEEFIAIGTELRSSRKGLGRWSTSIPTGLTIRLDNASGAKEFYRFVRQFMDKDMASMLTEAFRAGDRGSRRLLVGSIYRSGMYSRGVPMSRAQVDDWLNRSLGDPITQANMPVTGSKAGEAYSVANADGLLPSERLAKSRAERLALRRSTQIAGVQERLSPELAIAPQRAPVENPGTIPRVIDENGELKLSQTLDQFLDNDADFMRSLSEARRLSDPTSTASPDDVSAVFRVAEEREATLRAIYAREEELVDIQRELAAMPRFRTLEDGTREAVFPGHDDALVTQRAQRILDDMDLPEPVTADFELASGVSMTPREAELYTKYGFLTENYLRRAYSNMLGDTVAGQRIQVPKLSAADRANTPTNNPPAGGLEPFNYALQRPNQADEALDAIYGELGAKGSVRTDFTLGDLESLLTEFNPARSIPGYTKKAKRPLKPSLSVDEAKAIRDGELTASEVTRIVKTEGRSLTPEQAEMIRKNYGINVRATTRRETKQPMGIYVEWAENSTEAGRARIIQSLKDDIKLADENEYLSYAQVLLERMGPLQQRLDDLSAAIKAGDKPLPAGASESAARVADNLAEDIAARAGGQKPFSGGNADPLIKSMDDLEEGLNRTVWSPSRDANGMEEAIHQYQIANHVRVPSISDMDELARSMKTSTKMFGDMNRAFGNIVDAWSFATLFGPRFSMRNAIEELVFYVLTGGRIGDLYAGRRASTAMRTAFPRFTYEEVTDSAGKRSLELVIKSNVGLFNRLSRGYTLRGKLRDDMNQEWLAAITIPNTTKDDFIKAQLLWQAGDTSAYVNLFAKAMIRERSNLPVNITPRQESALEWIAGSQHGQSLVQDVAAGGNSLLNGRLPNVVEDVARLRDAPPGTSEALMKSYPNFGPGMSIAEYGALAPLKYDPTTGKQINGVWYWWRELQATVQGDGPIGKLAVKYLGNPDVAKKAIADYVRQDTRWGYRRDWSMFAEGRDIDGAAARYYENVLRNFQKPNGEINWKLRNSFVDKVNGEDIVSWYKPKKPGATPFDDFSRAEKTHRVSVGQLSQIPKDDRPTQVFGRLPGGAEDPVPVFTGYQGIITQGYGIIGRQNARISREPIFYANYLNMIKQLEKGDEAMAASMARAAGRDTPNEFDRAVAAEWTNRTAADSAYAMTLAYVDNPANRSMLAWKLRNVSRYYRATEDFWRRARRLAITRPEAYYRAALVYGVLDDTGFVFSDEEGKKYFYYPGNEYVQKAVGSIASLVSDDLKPFHWEMAHPFSIGGEVLGTTPSADPRMAIASAIGPGTFPFALAFDFVPGLEQFAGIRDALVGPYLRPQTSIVDLVMQTLTPAGVSRLQQLSQDQLDSTSQQAAYDTIKIMIAEGLLDPEDFVSGDGVIGIESFMQSDVWKEASTVGIGVAVTRFILSILGPAAPRIYQAGQITPAAREMGISGIDPVFRQLLELNKDEPDPWSIATSMYFAAKVRKATGQPTKYDPWDNLTPFTLSGSKPSPTKLAGLSGVRATDVFLSWSQSDEFKNLDKLPGGPESIMWLAPLEGEFDWTAWRVISATRGLRIPKTIEEKLENLFAATGQYQDTQIRKSYDELIGRLDPRDPDQREAINILNRQKSEERKTNERRNPYWNTYRSGTGTAFNQTRLAESVKQMEIFIDSIRESEYEMPEALVYIDSAIKIFRNYRAAAAGLGSSALQRQARIELIYEMNAKLQEIGLNNGQAQKFIDTVLDTLNYGELTQLDPILSGEVP